jgi:hypothetical protein
MAMMHERRVKDLNPKPRGNNRRRKRGVCVGCLVCCDCDGARPVRGFGIVSCSCVLQSRSTRVIKDQHREARRSCCSIERTASTCTATGRRPVPSVVQATNASSMLLCAMAPSFAAFPPFFSPATAAFPSCLGCSRRGARRCTVRWWTGGVASSGGRPGCMRPDWAAGRSDERAEVAVRPVMSRRVHP